MKVGKLSVKIIMVEMKAKSALIANANEAIKSLTGRKGRKH